MSNYSDFAIFTGLSTTGSANSLKSPITSGVITVTGPSAGMSRAKTVIDADDTILELSGSYTTTGTWVFNNTVTSPKFNVGTLSYAAANAVITTQASVAGFEQIVVQNSSATATASADIVVNNNNSTDTTYYGDFGINSGAYTGSGSLALPNATYLTSTTGDLVLGTTTSNAIHFIVNSGATDALTISTAGVVTLGTALASSSGGTGNAFTKFTGPTTAERTFTLPNSSETLLYAGGALGTPSSGTLTNCTFPTLNQSTSGTAAKATNLVGGNATTLLGSIPYQSNTDVTTLLAPNVTTTKKFLRETGDGTNGTAPAWDTIVIADLPTVTPAKGGTGVANGTSNTITFTGNFTLGVTLTAATDVTFPISGTLINSTDTAAKATILATARTIYGNSFDGSASLGQVISSLYGGTGNGFTKFSGPTTAERIFTLPDSSETLLYAGGALGTPSSGTLTNCTFPTLNQDTTGTAAKATNLVGGNDTTLLGSIPYQSSVNTTTLLAPNTTTTKKFLRQTGDGTNGVAPAWDIIVVGDLPIITPAKGGTGIANGSNNSITFSGNYTLSLTLTANTSLTLPTSGTLINSTDTAAKATILATTRTIYGNNFDGSAALTQVIASTYGGTGNGFTKFTGQTTAEKTFTLPDANATLLYSGGALGTPSSGTVTNLTGTASININGTVGATTPTTGVFTTLKIGTLGYTPANALFTAQSSIAGCNQLILQNSNTGVAASADIVINNNNSTDTTYYGDFGINSGAYTGTGSLNLPNATYLTSTTGDLVLGTTTSNAIHFVVNSGATDALTISTAGNVTATGTLTTRQLVVSNGFIANNTTISSNYTVVTGISAMSIGPITISSGVTITVAAGQKWVIL